MQRESNIWTRWIARCTMFLYLSTTVAAYPVGGIPSSIEPATSPMVRIEGESLQAVMACWSDLLQVAKGGQRKLANYTVYIRNSKSEIVIIFGRAAGVDKNWFGSITPNVYGVTFTVRRKDGRITRREVGQ